MCLVNLALITGNMGKPGTGINPLRGQNNVQGSAHMGCEPSNLAGYVPIDQGRPRFEAAWNHSVPEETGLTLMAMMDAAAEGRFHALWAIGYDVFFTNANAGRTQQAFENIDFVVVQDLFFNETARRFAHVFLPACSSFEREGTFMNAERRVQLVRKAIEPVGDSKPDWQIVQAVAKAMGHQKGFSFDSAQEIWDEVRTVWLPGAGMRYERLEAGGIQWPCPSEDHPGTAILHQDRFPTGPRASLAAIAYTATPETLSERFPILMHTGRSLYHFNAGTMTMRTKNREIRPSDVLDMHPDDAFALGLSQGQQVRVTSRHGSTELALSLDDGVRRGEAFATFHSPEVFINQVTSPVRDNRVGAPEYKVCAVRVEAIG
jgi:formate dehydrogenase major subunit